jgi:prepilin-type N-terminal cleavage/methylation domain-containing protein
MKNKKSGFTIIEFIVVIAIITIISGFMVVNFRKGEGTNKLLRVSQQVVQGIRESQNMALSSSEQTGQIYDYYGVHFNKVSMPGSFYIFASSTNAVYDSGEQVKTINLEEGIVIDSLSGGDQMDISFSSPYAMVVFNPAAPSHNVSIIIKIQGTSCPSSNCRTITINESGWININ